MLCIFEDHALPGFAGVAHRSRVSQIELNVFCERVRAAEHAPRDQFYFLEPLNCLAEIVERGGGVLVLRAGETQPSPSESA